MNTRTDTERQARADRRTRLAEQIRENTAPRHAHIAPIAATGDRTILSDVDAHLKELKIRAATAAYQALRRLGSPVHNARCIDAKVLKHAAAGTRSRVVQAALNVAFDIPYSSPEGRGVRTASIPVSYADNQLIVGQEFSFQDQRHPVTAAALGAVAAMRAPETTHAHVVVAAFVGDRHQILGATTRASAAASALRVAGFRVLLRNPQDAVGITVKEPFYEVLAGKDLGTAKRITAEWLGTSCKTCGCGKPLCAICKGGGNDMKKKAGLTAPEIPAGTTAVPASPELVDLRKKAVELSAAKQKLDEQVAAYADALAQKSGFANQGDVRQRIAALQEQIVTAADALAAPLIQLPDGTLMAKVSSARESDLAWKSYLDAISEHYAKAIATITRWTGWFRKMTVTQSWQEITPEQVDKTFTQNVKTREKVDKFVSDRNRLEPVVPAYLRGKGPKEPLKVAQANPAIAEASGVDEDSDPHLNLMLMEIASQELQDRADLTVDALTHLNESLGNTEEQARAQEEFPLPSPAGSPAPVASRAGQAVNELTSLRQQMGDAMAKLGGALAACGARASQQHIGAQKGSPEYHTAYAALREHKVLAGKMQHEGQQLLDELSRPSPAGQQGIIARAKEYIARANQLATQLDSCGHKPEGLIREVTKVEARRRPGSLDTPLTDQELLAVKSFTFSSAAEGRYGPWARVGSKARKVVASALARGFSPEEAEAALMAEIPPEK